MGASEDFQWMERQSCTECPSLLFGSILDGFVGRQALALHHARKHSDWGIKLT